MGPIDPGAAQERGIDERATGGIEFGDEDVGAAQGIASAVERAIEGPGSRREVGSARVPRHKHISRRVPGDGLGIVDALAAEIRCVDERVDPKRLIRIRVRAIVSDGERVPNLEHATDCTPRLFSGGSAVHECPRGRLDKQLAGGVEAQRLRALEMDPDILHLCTGRQQEVIFRACFDGRKHEVDAVVQAAIRDLAIARDVEPRS